MIEWTKEKIIDNFLVTDFVANGSFASLKENVSYLKERDYAILVRTTDNTKGWNGKYVFVSKDSYEFLKKSSLKPNDLIIANVGDPGKAFLCPDLKQPMTLGPNSILVRSLNENKINNKFFYFYTTSKIGQAQIEFICSATAQKKFNKTSYRNIEIPLPPLDQQKKIAAILDAADAYRQKTKALITKYDELTQSLFLELFGDPVRNPKGWEVSFLKQITTKIGSGATPRGGKQAYKKEGVSLIRSMNVYDNMFKYKNLAFIDEEQAAKLKNVIVEKGDVLFNITGASICRSSVVPNDVLPARVNQHVSILRPIKSIITSKFLSRFLISKNVKTKLLGVGSGGGAVMEAITKEQLQNIEVIVPPLDIQNQFADSVQAIETQKAQAQASLAQAEDLFNSLLQRAFKGELV